jgi:hypothetical protein
MNPNFNSLQDAAQITSHYKISKAGEVVTKEELTKIHAIKT